MKVSARKADSDNKVIQTVSTDRNGRYQFHLLKPGRYVIGPEQALEDETQKVFKPANRTVTAEISKKTNVGGF